MKKLISLLLALVFIMGMGVTASAVSSNSRIIGVLEPINGGVDPGLYDLRISDLGSDRSIYFLMNADMFEWDDGEDGLYWEPVTSSHVSHSRLAVHASNKTGAASSIIESVGIAYRSGSRTTRTAAVQVKFRAGAVTSSKRDFGVTLYLTLNGRRQGDSELRIEGTLADDTDSDIQSGDYLDISDGTILKPDRAVRNVELYLGSGVTMKTNLTARQRYSGIASSEVSSADNALLNRFTSIEDVIVIRQSGLKKSGNYVHIDTGSNYYVYNDRLEYIGRSKSTLPFSSKYYLSNKSINMGGSSVSEAQSPRSSADDHITRESALAQTKLALSTGKAAVVQYKDEDCVSVSTLQEMNAAAKNAGGTVSLVVDTTDSNNKIQGRLTIPTAGAAKLGSGEIELGVYTDKDRTSSTKANFEKWYANKVAVVSLAQKDTYGMPVQIAAKADLGSLKTSSLYLYSYDKSTKKCRQITGANASVDKSGYLHFNTTLAGDIIITDSPLKRR